MFIVQLLLALALLGGSDSSTDATSTQLEFIRYSLTLLILNLSWNPV
ncbi:hypothetical protein ABIC86_003229 [Paenibacillus sp. DS2363]